MNPNPTKPTEPRNIFITPGQLVEGTIVEVNVNQDPFHCTIKILPREPYIQAEGRYSDHEISLGKLKRNLVHLKFNIRNLEDIITAVESLDGRECIFRVDKSGWISWIPRLIKEPSSELVPISVPAPNWPLPALLPSSIKLKEEEKEIVEIFFIREPRHRSIYRMENPHGGVLGWAVGPTNSETAKPHGWVLNLATMEEAIEILKFRKNPLDK